MAYPAVHPQHAQQPPQQPPQQGGAAAGGAPDDGPRRRHSTRALLLTALAVGLLAGFLGGGIVAALDGPSPSTSATPGASTSADSEVPPLAERPPESVAGVADLVLPSTAFISVTSVSTSAEGSGIVLDTDGNILTNNHVATAGGTGATITVTLQDGSSADARIVGTVASMDLAVINADLPADVLVPARLGDSESLVVGDPVVAVGAPLGLQGTVTSGIVSALNRPVSVGGQGENTIFSAIQTDAAINPGNSGGPLANGNGEVVGVNSAIATLGGGPFGGEGGSIGVGFSIPMSQAQRIARELIATGSATRATLGVSVPADDTGTDGADVQDVTSGSAADQAGIQQGDVIVEFDGIRIPNGSSLIAQVRAQAPGDEVDVVIERGGERSTVRATLGSTPAE